MAKKRETIKGKEKKIFSKWRSVEGMDDMMLMYITKFSKIRQLGFRIWDLVSNLNSTHKVHYAVTSKLFRHLLLKLCNLMNVHMLLITILLSHYIHVYIKHIPSAMYNLCIINKEQMNFVFFLFYAIIMQNVD